MLFNHLDCPVSHDEMAEQLARWLRVSQQAWFAIANFRATGFLELPDVFAMTSTGFSCVIEVKVSRSDFLADARKPHRQQPERGIGNQRYYCAPKGTIDPSELPEGWGLIEPQFRRDNKVAFKLIKGSIVCRRRIIKKQPAKMGSELGFIKDETAEQRMMMQILSRVSADGVIQRYSDATVYRQNPP